MWSLGYSSVKSDLFFLLILSNNTLGYTYVIAYPSGNNAKLH